MCISIYPGWWCLCAHACLLGLNAFSSAACLGSVTSSFSGFGANLVNEFTGPSEPDVLAVSEVSPFEVEVALGMKAQQQDARCWLLQW